MQPPVMPEDGHTTRVTSGEDASSPGGSKDSSVLEALWDDEDTRAFYECLPDLRLFSGYFEGLFFFVFFLFPEVGCVVIDLYHK